MAHLGRLLTIEAKLGKIRERVRDDDARLARECELLVRRERLARDHMRLVKDELAELVDRRDGLTQVAHDLAFGVLNTLEKPSGEAAYAARRLEAVTRELRGVHRRIARLAAEESEAEGTDDSSCGCGAGSSTDTDDTATETTDCTCTDCTSSSTE